MTPRIGKQTIKVVKTARYYTLNSVQQKTLNIWFVMHGYGQAAEHFIKHFKELDPQTNYVVAPEGMSRFYLEGVSGRVGASWMTNEDREDEIADIHAYLNSVRDDIGIDIHDSKYRIILFGFSQGTASAVRWLVRSGVKAYAIILWAGSFPHDVEPALLKGRIGKSGLHYVYGTEDSFLKNIDIDDKLAPLRADGIEPRLWTFDGGHTMNRTLLHSIVDSFDRK